MAHPEKQAALAAALAKLDAPREAKPAASDRPLLWGVQAQVDRLAASFGPGVEVVAIPLSDGGVAYEFRKASAAQKRAA